MNRTRWSVVAGAAVVGALATFPLFVNEYTLSALARIIALAVLAVSVAVLTGAAGLPTLGQVAPFTVGMYTTVVLSRAEILTGPVLILASAAAAALFSVVVGAAVIRTRGVVFMMVTLAVGELTTNVAAQWTSVTGGTDGSERVEPTVPFWGAEPFADDAAVYQYCLTVGVIVVVAAILVLRAAPGRLLHGLRDSEPRMRASGHRVPVYLLSAYVAAGAIAGVGGSLLTTSQRTVFPSDADFSVSALMLLAVAIGGANSLVAVVAATAAVLWIRDWASVAIPGKDPLLLGAIFVAAVYLLPTGLGDVVKRLRPARREKVVT